MATSRCADGLRRVPVNCKPVATDHRAIVIDVREVLVVLTADVDIRGCMNANIAYTINGISTD